MKLVVLGGSSCLGLEAARLGIAAGWDATSASRGPARVEATAGTLVLESAFAIGSVVHVDGGHRLAAP